MGRRRRGKGIFSENKIDYEPGDKILAGTRFVEFRPMIPLLAVFALGIVTDALWGSTEEIESSVSPVLWSWLILFLFSCCGYWGLIWFLHPKKLLPSFEPEGHSWCPEDSDLKEALPQRSQVEFPPLVKRVFQEETVETHRLGEWGGSIGRFFFDVLERFGGGIWNLFRSEKKYVSLQIAFFLLSVMALGGAYHHFYWAVYPESEISRNIRESFSLEFIEGKVIRAPEVRMPPTQFGYSEAKQEPLTILLLKVIARNTVYGRQEASGTVMVRIHGLLKDTHIGDHIRVSGRLTRFSEAVNPKSFSARHYYRQQRILALLRVPAPENIQRVSRPRIWSISRIVEYLRDTASRQLERFLTPETKPMAAALILGCREEVDPEEMEMMLETGTIHLMAISGLHVGLLAGGFFLLARFLGFGNLLTAIFVLGFVWLYVLVSGSRPPALRAGVIVTMFTVSFLWERSHSHLNALAAAGIFVLLINPTSIFSTGTQLSFLAVGTLLSMPVLRDDSMKKSLGRKDVNPQVMGLEFFFVRDAPHGMIGRFLLRKFWFYLLNLFYSSFQMTLVLLPLTLGAFHVAALIGIFLNVFLWLPLMVAMMSGGGVLFLGGQPLIGPFLGWLCSSSLSAMNWLIAFGAGIPGHCFWMRGTPIFWNLILYAFLISWAVFPKTRLRSKKHYLVFILGMLLLLVPFLSENVRRRGEFRCSFIAVSHGLSILLQFPNGKTVLYDAGQFAPEEYPSRTISSFLWNSGVHRLDSIFVSHPDMDHYNAFPGLLKRFSVGEVFLSSQTLSVLEEAAKAEFSNNLPAKNGVSEEDISRNSLLGNETSFRETDNLSVYSGRKTAEEIREGTLFMIRKFYSALKRWNVPIRTVQAGDRIHFSPDCSVTVLHPTRVSMETHPEHTNGNSLVLLIEYEGKRFLLTGDLSPPGLEYFLELEPIACDVILAPHHGGKNCCTPEFVKWCSPEYCVISESFNNPQKKTVEFLTESGVRVHHTGRDGAVIFRVRDGRLEVFTRNEWKEWN